LAGAAGLTLYRVAWLRDWLLAEPLPWALLALALAAYCASLLVWRRSRRAYRSRPGNPLTQALALAVLALGILWLMLSLLRDLTMQAKAVLGATAVDRIALVPLLKPELSSTEPLLWAAVLAGSLTAVMCAGA
ncbi:MAG: hypothetical protein C0405_13005, partial [Desulfovibrio sp.]|nr:hypothetical protein [Desulfovibrio sp.]